MGRKVVNASSSYRCILIKTNKRTSNNEYNYDNNATNNKTDTIIEKTNKGCRRWFAVTDRGSEVP